MFELNFIAEPGIQSENSDACWSFLHKRKRNDKEAEENTVIAEKIMKKSKRKYYTGAICALIMIAGFSFYFKSQQQQQ